MKETQECHLFACLCLNFSLAANLVFFSFRISNNANWKKSKVTLIKLFSLTFEGHPKDIPSLWQRLIYKSLLLHGFPKNLEWFPFGSKNFLFFFKSSNLLLRLMAHAHICVWYDATGGVNSLPRGKPSYPLREKKQVDDPCRSRLLASSTLKKVLLS